MHSLLLKVQGEPNSLSPESPKPSHRYFAPGKVDSVPKPDKANSARTTFTKVL
ncbi:hypothetical protein VKT23_015856 [Stygiomarasmius scandens]|uniref:Uncharacterized protein n=1 Tax=Marasmiellus scandens TaxID=2682957 RepID=A0ABR1IZ81_9AGAR